MVVKRIRCGTVNCFIVEDGDDAVLVDTGIRKYRDKIEKECEKVSLSLIVLTHGHIDHIGNAAYLSKRFHVPIAMHKLDVPLIENNLSQPLACHTFPGKILKTISEASMKRESAEVFQPSVFLKQGDTLEEYGVNATVIRLTGHTKGSIGLKVGKSDFIVGDALMNMFYPSIALIYTDREKLRSSGQIISQSGDRLIHFGHGRSIKNRIWKG